MKLIPSIFKLLQLSNRERLLLGEGLVCLCMARAAILLVPWRRIAPLLGRHQAESPAATDEAHQALIKDIGRAITITSRHTPWESKCLVQALAGKLMLRRRKISNTIYFGVAKGTDKDKPLIAHAWLRSGPLIVTGKRGMNKFTVTGKFAD